jgi:hypothetical protein
MALGSRDALERFIDLEELECRWWRGRRRKLTQRRPANADPRERAGEIGNRGVDLVRS